MQDDGDLQEGLNEGRGGGPAGALREALAGLSDPLALLEGLLTYSPVPYAVFDRDGFCLLTNPAFVGMFGRAPPPGYNVLKDEVTQRLGIAGLVRRAFKGESLQGPTVWYDPGELSHVDGSGAHRVAISCTFFSLTASDGAVTQVAIAYKDVTAELRAREEAEVAQRRTLAVTNNATLGLLMMDARQQCVFMNPAAERIIGYRLEELRGRPLHDVVHHTRPDGTPYPMEDCPIDRALPTRAHEQGEDVFVRRDGSFYPVAFTASPILQDGVAVGTVIELRETSEERRREAERERLLEDLTQAVRLRDEFLSVASHELKTPLTPLMLKIAALERDALRANNEWLRAEEALAHTEILKRQTRKLTQLVDDLLDVSRLTRGHVQLRPQKLDLVSVVQDLTASFASNQATADHRIELEASGEILGLWDRARIEQVVTNLLTNAVKYGGGAPISLRLIEEEGEAVLTVTDRGIGISTEALPRIFEKFERAVSDRHYGGLGLGLYIARQVVESMGGKISVRSAPGEGATFTVTLPVRGGDGGGEAA